jgi:hypothetical protein
VIQTRVESCTTAWTSLKKQLDAERLPTAWHAEDLKALKAASLDILHAQLL